MRKVSENDWIQYIQILTCAVIGMFAGLFVGKSGTVTITATGMLVLYTE